jgi:hypothetical protein
MAGANRTLSPKRAAERMRQHRHAVMVLAKQSKAIKAQLRAQGVKLSEVSAKDINIQVDTYFDVYRERLIAEAEHTIETWPGFARWCVGTNISSDAQLTNLPIFDVLKHVADIRKRAPITSVRLER